MWRRAGSARRLVRVALRVEVLFFLMVVAIVIGFVWTYSAQR
jgi:hypothetical protein